MDDLEIQRADFSELDAATLYRILRLRVDVFVVEQECPYPELDGRDLEPGTRHLWVESGGEAVAYLRVLDDGDDARIGRVAVAVSHRSAGLAARLMRAAHEVIGRRDAVLDAQSYVQGWYERLGYRVDGAEFLEDGIAHVPMRRPFERSEP